MKVHQTILKDESITLDKANNEARTYKASLVHMSQYTKQGVNIDLVHTSTQDMCGNRGKKTQTRSQVSRLRY